VKLSPQRLSAFTRRMLEAEGMRVFDCSRCGESKIGPVDRDVCLTCEPTLRTFPLKKRRGSVKKPPRTACSRGHELTEENKYRKRSGYVVCRTCRTIDSVAWNARHAEERNLRKRIARRRSSYGTSIPTTTERTEVRE
jgi:hypothetical protein